MGFPRTKAVEALEKHNYDLAQVLAQLLGIEIDD